MKGVQFHLAETEMSLMAMVMAKAIMINVLFQIIHIIINRLRGGHFLSKTKEIFTDSLNFDDVDILGLDIKIL